MACRTTCSHYHLSAAEGTSFIFRDPKQVLGPSCSPSAASMRFWRVWTRRSRLHRRVQRSMCCCAWVQPEEARDQPRDRCIARTRSSNAGIRPWRRTTRPLACSRFARPAAVGAKLMGRSRQGDSRLATYLLIGFGADDVGFAGKAPNGIELAILEFDQLPLALCALGRWVEVGEALEPSHLRRLGVRKKVGAKLSETKNSPRCSARHQRQTNPRMR